MTFRRRQGQSPAASRMVNAFLNNARWLALFTCALFLPVFVGPIQIAVLVLLALLVVERLREGRPLPRRQLDAAVALYVVAIAVSLLGDGRLPKDRLALAVWPLAAWACVAQINWARFGPRTLPRLVAIHLTVAAIIGVLALLQHWYGSAFRPWGPGFPALIQPAPGAPERFTANGLMGDRVDLAITLLLPILAGTAVAVSPGIARHRALALGAAVLSAAGVVVTYVRAAWIAGAVALTLTVLIARGRRMALAVVVVLVGAAFALGVASPGIRGRALSAVSVAENVDRTSMWERTRALVAEYPLQGVGYGRYEAATRELFGPPPRGQPEHRGPHNIYLQATAEIGLLGAGALLILFAAALAAGFRAASGAHAGSQRRIIGAVAVGTVTAVAISGLFHDVLDIGQIAFELWIVVGLAESQISDGPERLSERQEDDARVDGQ